MTKAQYKELTNILTDIAKDLVELKKNYKVLHAKGVMHDEEFKKIGKDIRDVGLVCAETQLNVEQVRTHVMSAVSKQGEKIRKLELVKNGATGGGRPSRKNS